VPVEKEMTAIPVGKAEVRRRGRSLALLAFGSMVTPALEVGEKLDATVVNMRFIKPLDEALVREMAETHDVLVTIDENVVAGGAGGAVSEYLASIGLVTRVVHIGLPDEPIQHGTREEMLVDAGLTAPQILEQLLPLRVRGDHLAQGSA
jgi:1-deoxy-D-xylulose-5-phosphate synthase